MEEGKKPSDKGMHEQGAATIGDIEEVLTNLTVEDKIKNSLKDISIKRRKVIFLYSEEMQQVQIYDQGRYSRAACTTERRNTGADTIGNIPQ